MGIKISKFSEGVLPIVVAACAGQVVVNDYFVDVKAADIALNGIVDLGPLPAYHGVVDAVLVPDDLDGNAAPTLTLDVGIMSGAPGVEDDARTCGSELFAASTAAQAGTPTRMSAASGFKIKPVGFDRSIGVKFAAGAATAQAGRIRLRMLMTGGDQHIQF